MRLAILTVDCFVSSPSVGRFIERNHDSIALVVRSSAARHSRPRPLAKLFRTWRRSGGGFIYYLLINFLVFHVLTALIDRLAALFPARLRAISLKSICRRHGIPVLSVRDVNDPASLRTIRATGADLSITYFFDQILKRRSIDATRLGVINVHPGILPEFRGIFPMLHALVDERPRLGVTIHEIEDETIDTGAILAQRAAPSPRRRCFLAAYKSVMDGSVEMLEAVIDGFADLSRNATAQSGGCYYSTPTRASIDRLRQLGYRMVCIRQMIAELWRNARLSPERRPVTVS